MAVESSQVVAVTDRRVLRTREALFAAAVRLVSDRGSTSVSVTELAEGAGVSRQAVYLNFGDRESLFAAAAMDLTERELYPLFSDLNRHTLRMRTLASAQHLARHHRFYRALISGSTALALKKAAISSFETLHRRAGVPVLKGMSRDDAAVARTFLVGGAMALIDEWLDEAGDHEPDPLVLTERIIAVTVTFTGFDTE